MIIAPEFATALAVLVAMTAIMTGAWAFCLRRGNGGWTDVFWTWGTGATLAAAALAPSEAWPPHPRQLLVAAMIAVWTVRLGAYLTPRVASHPEDARYAGFRRRWGADYARQMLFVTLPQAPATALLSLSVASAARQAGPLGARDLAAVALFALAILGEAVADGQMKAYRASSPPKDGVMDRGLWAWSRHPNYLFQWLGWLAYPVIALRVAEPVTWLSLAGPVVMYVLLRYISGVPPLEAVMVRSRGEAFRDYQRRVSVFFPLPPKRA